MSKESVEPPLNASRVFSEEYDPLSWQTDVTAKLFHTSQNGLTCIGWDRVVRHASKEGGTKHHVKCPGQPCCHRRSCGHRHHGGLDHAGYGSRNSGSIRECSGQLSRFEGAKIYYEECGTGDEALLLVHDGVVHSAVWDDVWPVFCNNFHTIRYDRRGYGRSPVSTSWYTETDDMLALLHHLRVRHTMLVGSSHGGELSIEFALERPGLVEELVLVGAVVHGYPYSDHFLNRGQATWAPVEKNNVAAAITRIAEDKYLTAADHPAARQKIRDLLTAAPQDFMQRDMARDLPSSLPRLREIHVPTLILVGDADIPDVHAHAGVIETGIPTARRIVPPDRRRRVARAGVSRYPARGVEQALGQCELQPA